MSLHENLARTEHQARLADAEQARRSSRLVRARRASRRAERAALQARLVLARSL